MWHTRLNKLTGAEEMENNKRFAFLITDGDTLLLLPSWGETVELAESYLSLNPSWSVVKEQDTILSFIREEKAQGLDTQGLSDILRKDLERFREDLELLKQSIPTKELKNMKIRKALDNCGYNEMEATKENLIECFLDYVDCGAFGNLTCDEAEEEIQEGIITLNMMCSNLFRL